MPLLRNLVVGSIAGFPVGLIAFRPADLDTAKLAVGSLITAFVQFCWSTSGNCAQVIRAGERGRGRRRRQGRRPS